MLSFCLLRDTKNRSMALEKKNYKNLKFIEKHLLKKFVPGIEMLSGLLRDSKNHGNTQMIYQSCVCLWLLSYSNGELN